MVRCPPKYTFKKSLPLGNFKIYILNTFISFHIILKTISFFIALIANLLFCSCEHQFGKCAIFAAKPIKITRHEFLEVESG